MIAVLFTARGGSTLRCCLCDLQAQFKKWNYLLSCFDLETEGAGELAACLSYAVKAWQCPFCNVKQESCDHFNLTRDRNRLLLLVFFGLSRFFSVLKGARQSLFTSCDVVVSFQWRRQCFCVENLRFDGVFDVVVVQNVLIHQIRCNSSHVTFLRLISSLKLNQIVRAFHCKLEVLCKRYMLM